MKRALHNSLLTLAALACCPSAYANQSEEEPLVFGMSTALEGPASNLGIQMRAGVWAAFQETNQLGGIAGRRLELVSLNDGYEPKLTVPNVKSLIEEHQSLAILGNVGTPTAVSALPIIEKMQVPFIFPYTGAGNLRLKQPSQWVINYRASYAQETAAMVDALILHGGLKVEEIAFFTQRDSYGDAGFHGGLGALQKHGLENVDQVTHGRYERNTLAVEKGLARLMMAETTPKAVIMVGTYAPCAKAILMAREYELGILFLNVSFVGATSLAENLGDDANDVIVTQVVPHIHSDLPLVKDYRSAMRQQQGPEAAEEDLMYSFPSLEGYIAGRILALGLEKIDGEITHESLRDALLSLGEFDLGLDVKLELGKEHTQASQTVWPTIIENGEVHPFDWTSLKTRWVTP